MQITIIYNAKPSNNAKPSKQINLRIIMKKKLFNK